MTARSLIMRGLNSGPMAKLTALIRTRCASPPGAGQTLGRLCSKLRRRWALTGLEFACGIPGTVGGAVYMNAGAYGSELKDVLESVTFLGQRLCSCAHCLRQTWPWATARACFEQNPDWCILSATVVLHRGDGAADAGPYAGAAGQAQGKAAP